MELLDRFLRYVSIGTQSDPASGECPSTPGQSVFLHALADELREMGAADVTLHADGYVTASIPATSGCESEPVIGFLAHVDTSPDAPGEGVKPQLHERDGEVIVTSDGTTLLGADDKAGVAEIMTAVEILLSGGALSPSQDASTACGEGRRSVDEPIRHCRVRIAFTTDEEIGRGVDRFDVEAFGADFAYTVDGGAEGELEYENFNAAEALVAIRGVSSHPGYAKGRMVNALRVAAEFDAMLPADQRPESTEGYEGFYHLTRLDGTAAGARMEYIVRDFDAAGFDRRKEVLVRAAAALDAKYGGGTVNVALRDRYRNMREVVEQHPGIVERAARAMRAAGVEPVVVPIRGGTDGARLSHMGLPCPNLFTGGRDFHSLSESVSLRAMQKAVRTIVEIVRVPSVTQ